MARYIFQFGNHPALSKAEIKSRLPQLTQIGRIYENVVSFEGDLVINPQDLLDTLGGTIRICEVFEVCSKFGDLLLAIEKHLRKRFKKDKKNVFGVSIFPHEKRILNSTLLSIKNLLKKDFSIRFLNRNFRNLDAGTLHKENLFKKGGMEICIYKKSGEYYLSETVAAQNIDKLSKRDYGKPVRDMQVGMLPPKLAMMMLNLASEKGQLPGKIWDPFCGTGTVLVEASMMGIEPIGSDISGRMINISNKNFVHYFSNDELQIFKHNAALQLQGTIDADAVCCETYLGHTYSKPLSEAEFYKVRNLVSVVLEGFFDNLHRNFSGNTAVVAIPFWRLTQGRTAFLKKPLEIAQKMWQTSQDLDYTNKDRHSFLYSRPSQITGREIFVFKRR